MLEFSLSNYRHRSARFGLITLVAVVLASGAAVYWYAEEPGMPIQEAKPLPPNERGNGGTRSADVVPGGPNGPAPRSVDEALARVSSESDGPYRTEANSKATLEKRLRAANAVHSGGPYGPPSVAERLARAPKPGGSFDDPFSPVYVETKNTDSPTE